MKRKTLFTIISLMFALSNIALITAQSSIKLDEVLQSVLSESYTSTNAENIKEIAVANFDFFNSQLKPTIGLSANVPRYTKTFSPVIQPDGTISFTSIKQANSSLSVYATQVIPQTGGIIFINSDLQRFDDLSFESKQYNGNPIRLGVQQPIFGFNPWKYQKDIQQFTLEESRLNYNISIEESLGKAADLYFNILIAKQNLEIAETNKLVNEKLLTITEERLALGKVSKDEKLQLEIELNNAKISVSQAKFDVEQSISTLFTFIGKTSPNQDIQFVEPEIKNQQLIDIESLIKESKINRPEVMAFQKEKRQAEMDLAEAKRSFGVQADLQASIGLARGAEQIGTIYTDPLDEQQFNISLVVPILDWGKKKSAMKIVKIREQNIEATYEQQFLELENNLRQRAYLFTRLQTEVGLLKEIMEKADERFIISNERYVLGDIEITNLTLAQREKDQAKRNYINALKSYWVTYYELRALSGFDIINNQKIKYQ